MHKIPDIPDWTQADLSTQYSLIANNTPPVVRLSVRTSPRCSSGQFTHSSSSAGQGMVQYHLLIATVWYRIILMPLHLLKIFKDKSDSCISDVAIQNSPFLPHMRSEAPRCPVQIQEARRRCGKWQGRGMAYLPRLFSQLGLIAAAGSHFPCN